MELVLISLLQQGMSSTILRKFCMQYIDLYYFLRYWCSNKTQGGGASTYRIPNGLTYAASGSQGLPHAPYSNPIGAVIQAWRPGQFSCKYI